MLSPLWTRQNIQVQKSLVLITEELAHNLSQSCEKRTHQVGFIVSALIRRRWTVLISRCLAP